MKNLFIIFFFPIALFATHGNPRIEDSVIGRETIIKVLTHEDLNGSLIEIKGGFLVKDPSTLKQLTSSYFKKRFYLSATQQGLVWGQLFKGIHQLEITPKDKKTSILIDGIQYRGKVTGYDISGKIYLVIETKVDDYVKSILSGRFGYRNLHQTTLEALAIAIRTDLYHKIATSNNPYWDLQATDHKFSGSSQQMIHSTAEAAVKATKNLIMIYKNRPFPTDWSENCGGKTASYKTIFCKEVNSPPGVFVPFAQKMRNQSKWKCSISKRVLAKALGLETIESIELSKEGVTDKVYAITFKGPNLTFSELSFIDFQKLIGENRVQSNDFTIKSIDERIECFGYGKGLGVGICLLSAKEMAESNTSTARVLSHFFPETKIMKLEFVPQVFFEAGSDTEEDV
jgi:stage II sporulation protein D